MNIPFLHLLGSNNQVKVLYKYKNCFKVSGYLNYRNLLDKKKLGGKRSWTVVI